MFILYVYGLFNDATRRHVIPRRMVVQTWAMNWQGSEEKWKRPSVMQYPGHFSGRTEENQGKCQSE